MRERLLPTSRRRGCLVMTFSLPRTPAPLNRSNFSVETPDDRITKLRAARIDSKRLPEGHPTQSTPEICGSGPTWPSAARSATSSSAEHSARGSTERPTPGTHWYSARSCYRSPNQVRSRAPLGLRTTGDAVPEEPHHLWPALYEEHSGGLLSQAATLNSSAWCLKVIDTYRRLPVSRPVVQSVPASCTERNELQIQRVVKRS